MRTTACVDHGGRLGRLHDGVCRGHHPRRAFSIVGSIGVVAGCPMYTGCSRRAASSTCNAPRSNYKRTVNIFTPNTEEGLAKFDEELKLVHGPSWPRGARHRKGRLAGEIESVCTGESWLALNAEPLGLVDGLITSDAYLRSRQRRLTSSCCGRQGRGRPAGLLALLRQAGEVAAEAARRCGGGDSDRAWQRSSSSSSSSKWIASPGWAVAQVAPSTAGAARQSMGRVRRAMAFSPAGWCR